MRFYRLKIVLAFLCLNSIAASAESPLVVHEWGTITTRHAPDGTPAGRLNRIDPTEELPAFVHRYEPPETSNDPSRVVAKAVPIPGRPDVTMRLETPVLYFYPKEAIAPFDLSVTFHGGIVNEFYPDATPKIAMDYERITSKVEQRVGESWNGNDINNFVVGTLDWKGVTLGDSGMLEKTTFEQWNAPRQVKAQQLQVGKETEKYLFYRGVAHLAALVQTKLSQNELVLSSPKELHWMVGKSMIIGNMWFADIRADGSTAFRALHASELTKGMESKELLRTALFTEGEYGKDGRAKLRASMKVALTEAGLFEDEAEAMLNTWKVSYFEKPGARIFYTVPKEWLDVFLPLTVSVPTSITRVFIGRVDLLPSEEKR